MQSDLNDLSEKNNFDSNILSEYELDEQINKLIKEIKDKEYEVKNYKGEVDNIDLKINQ